MAKDPAFLFYPNDWLGGTMGMTFEEKGAYMELLMMQFNRGHMTKHMIGQTVGQLWDKLQDKFIKDADGLWYSVRLDEEKMKRKKFTDSRKNNVLGKNQHKKKVGHMTSHMENVNESVNEDVIKKGVQGEKITEVWFEQIFDSISMADIRSTFPQHDLPNELNVFKLKVRGSPSNYIHRDAGSIRSAFIYQLKNSRNGNRNNTKASIRRADATIENGREFGEL